MDELLKCCLLFTWPIYSIKTITLNYFDSLQAVVTMNLGGQYALVVNRPVISAESGNRQMELSILSKSNKNLTGGSTDVRIRLLCRPKEGN